MTVGFDGKSLSENGYYHIAAVRAATQCVARELKGLGFYNDEVAQVDVYLVWFGVAYGRQYYRGDGSICILALSWSKLTDLMRRQYTSLRTVLRHEYAHAIADTHRGLMRPRQLTRAFGKPHGWSLPSISGCFQLGPKET